MRILIARSKWDMPDEPLESFLRKIKESGFDASDIHLPTVPEPPDEIARLHKELGLELVGMIAPDGKTPQDHLRSLERLFPLAASSHPLRINCHTGKDYFSLHENLALFKRGQELSAEYGIPISHETHRGRATFSTISTRDLLNAFPEIRLTADFSHWCCVHESLLADQEESVELAIKHSDYIHARVGHIEGPQITDPRAPEWQQELEAHLNWWIKIVDARRLDGMAQLVICPEFGPAPYMPQLPFTRQPVANLGKIVLYMKDLIREKLM